MEFIKRKAAAAWGDRHRIARYIISGGTAAVVNIFTMFALTHWFGVWYLISSVIAFMIAVCISFTLQKFWTFVDRSTHGMKGQMAMYIVVALCSVAINTGLVFIQVDFIGIHYVLAQIISNGLIAVVNFFVYQKLVFIKKI